MNDIAKILKEKYKKVKDKCEAELKENMKSYSKLKDGPMMTEDFALQDYIKEMTVEDA